METRAGTGTVTRLVAKPILDQDKDDSVGHGSRIPFLVSGWTALATSISGAMELT